MFPTVYAGVAALTIILPIVGWFLWKGTESQAGSYNEEKQKVLENAIDYVKVTLGLAVGSLVFGVGLIAGAATLPYWVRVYALTAAVLLVCSAIFGMFALSSLVGKIEKYTYGLDDMGLRIPGLAHLVYLGVAVGFIGLALYATLWDQPDADVFCAASPKVLMDKVLAARAVWLPKTAQIYKMASLDLVKGVDAAKGRQFTWHVQIETVELAPKGRTAAAHGVRELQPRHEYVDLYANAYSGELTVVPAPASSRPTALNCP